MAGVKVNYTYEQLMAEVKQYISNPKDLALIEKAYLYAADKHKHQKRRSGEPYLVHLVQVSYILSTMRVGPKTIVAGLLHDVIEDCGVTKEEFLQDFDEEIYNLVDAVTKIGNIEFKDEKEYLAENHRKIFIAMAKDIRVIIIKLVDRLHNMRTLQHMPPEKQRKIAAETLDVYAPISHRLGISSIKNELEDLSFQYLDRDKYYEIARLVEQRRSERDAHINKMIEDISAMLKELNISFRIFGRSKHLYSIYKKMLTKDKAFGDILDLLAIRIITDTELTCYEILGYIHQKYRPIPGRLKDYIAMPKMNMYQSLHTTIVGDAGNIFEVQIRTEQMDSVAEKGVAAHWRYKEGSKYNPAKEQKEIEEKLTWFKDLITLKDEMGGSDAQGFMDALQVDLFDANVYVMSPKGRVIDLPNGSTPIDFAYRIHTEVGHKTVGAIVNGNLVPLTTVLKTGDVVELRTSKQSPGPSEDWLKIVKTSNARNKIRSFISKKMGEKREPVIEKGQALFRDEIIRRGYDQEYLSGKKLEHLYGMFNYNNAADFYYAIAVKAITISAIMEKIYNRSTPLDNQEVQRLVNKNEKKSVNTKHGISVAGIDSMMISLAGCCQPVYGDEVVGFITKGQGVKVHRVNCVNIAQEKQRLIDVTWDDNQEHLRYPTSLYVESSNRNNILSEIIAIVSAQKANMTFISAQETEDGMSSITRMTVNVTDLKHLNTLMTNLRKIDGVYKVDRMNNG